MSIIINQVLLLLKWCNLLIWAMFEFILHASNYFAYIPYGSANLSVQNQRIILDTA